MPPLARIAAAALLACLALGAGVALAAGAPVATTGDAEQIDHGGSPAIRLHGVVTADDSSTNQARFDYGTTTAYGQSADVAERINRGAGDDPVTATLDFRGRGTPGGLEPGTTYHYRLVASNASGTSTGEDRTFTTAGAPPSGPVATTGAARYNPSISPSIDLKGSVRSTGFHDGTWYFEYGPTTAYGKSSPERAYFDADAPTAVGFQIKHVPPSTTYHYRLVASDAFGTSLGADRTITTPAARVDPPVLEVFELVPSTRLRLDSRGRLKVLVRCSKVDCRGSARLRAVGRLGSSRPGKRFRSAPVTRFRFRRPGLLTLRMRLSRGQRAAIRGGRYDSGLFLVRYRDSKGNRRQLTTDGLFCTRATPCSR